MNPRVYIFVLNIFLMASLQVEAAYSAGGEAAGKQLCKYGQACMILL